MYHLVACFSIFCRSSYFGSARYRMQLLRCESALNRLLVRVETFKPHVTNNNQAFCTLLPSSRSSRGNSIGCTKKYVCCSSQKPVLVKKQYLSCVLKTKAFRTKRTIFNNKIELFKEIPLTRCQIRSLMYRQPMRHGWEG